MALTRKFLTALGIEAEKIDEIINAHTETVDALKEDRDTYKADADKLKEVQEKLDNANKKLAEAEENDGKDKWKIKYDAIKEEFDTFKDNVETEKAKSTKTEAYKKLLNEIGISEKRLNSVLKVSSADIDEIELDADGNIKNVDELKKSLTEEWGDFIVKNDTKGANTTTPPANNGGKQKLTKKEIMEIKDTTERQNAWKEYIENGGN